MRSTRRRNPYKRILPSDYFPRDLERLAQRSEEGYRDAIEEAVDLALATAIRAAESADRYSLREILRREAYAIESLLAARDLAHEFEENEYDAQDADERHRDIERSLARRDDRARAWEIRLPVAELHEEYLRGLIRHKTTESFEDVAEGLATELRVARRDRSLIDGIVALEAFLARHVYGPSNADVVAARDLRMPTSLRARVMAERAELEARDEYEESLGPEVAKAKAKKQARRLRAVAAAGARR